MLGESSTSSAATAAAAGTDKRTATILVTDAGRGSAIAIIRSLGRRGYRVLATDSDPRSLGFRSRFAARTDVYPSPEQAPQLFCDHLLEIAAREHVDLVVPVTDWTVRPLAERRADFQSVTRLALPAGEALQVVNDKLRTLELAARLGVPAPPTRVVHTVQEALAAAADFGWPLVLKPQASHQLTAGKSMEAFQVTYAGSRADLEREMSRFEGHCSVLLQAYCRGVGHGVELLLDGGRPLAAFQHQRLREVPVTGGASAYRQSVALDPRLYADAVRLMQELRWDGLAMVEFKVDGDAHRLMEINGRVWGSLPLAVAAGVDFPGLLADLYLHGAGAVRPQLGSGYRLGVRSRDLGRDCLWIGSVLAQRRRYPFLPMPPRRRALMAIASLFDPRRKLDILTWSDPLPGLLELPRIASKLWRKQRAARGSESGTPRRPD